MPPVYRFTEIVVYSLLNFLPFLALALYPFRHSLRFSKGVTGILIGLLSVIQVLLGVWVSFVPGNHAAIASALSTALYAAFYFLAVKKHFGKTLFTLLMLSNLANFAVISAKCLEGILFPAFAMQSYRWSFSLMLFAVEIILSVPIFLYMKSVFTPAVEKEPSGFEWRYLWLIPTTFYIIWYFAIYSVVSRSALEIALRPKNTLFLFIINVGAILIYYVVTRLILEQNTTLELKEKNHQLSMQAVQYENLQEKSPTPAVPSTTYGTISRSCRNIWQTASLTRYGSISAATTTVCRTIRLFASVKMPRQTPYCSISRSRQRTTTLIILSRRTFRAIFLFRTPAFPFYSAI